MDPKPQCIFTPGCIHGKTWLYTYYLFCFFSLLTFSNCHPLFCNNHHSNVGCSEQERKVGKVGKVRKASTLRITILEEGCVS